MKNEVYDFSKIMQCFWKTNIMYDESVLMVSEDGNLPEARLLFKPHSILSVRNSHLDMEYNEGTDWIFEDGKLKLLRGTRAEFLTKEELYPSSPIEGWTFDKLGGGHVLFHEEHYFHDKQLSVTYTLSQNSWKGPVPYYQGNQLSVTMNKLENKKPRKLILFGDSISEGANASYITCVPPFMPSWGELTARKLREVYQCPVDFKNPSVGGKDSEWGKNNAHSLVSMEKPDLVIIAFGMNDGTAKVLPKVFKQNISSIIEDVKASKPETEFILVSGMLANPETYFSGLQAEYKQVLQELTCNGVVFANMTDIHNELLKYKKLRDMTGNNINHPNDYLIRWYAQVVSAILIENIK